MAETAGLVQQITVLSATATCVWIGPKPDNTTLLLVTNDGSTQGLAFSGSMVQALTSASTNYRAVAATHGDNDSTITTVRIDPV